MKKLACITILILIDFLIIVVFLDIYYAPNSVFKYSFYIIAICLLFFTCKFHEKTHWKEAEKYHKLINPRIISAHFDCDNWEEFSSKETKNVALAGIHFDKKFNAWFLFFFDFFEPLTIVFTVIAILGNAIPIRFSKTFATDDYWRDHPEEFLKSKRQN